MLSRQAFRLQETIPLFFGLIKRTVDIVGTVTWDDDTKVSLYESVTEGQGIEVWKLREFAEVEVDGKVMTRVTETIEGKCPGWLRFIVQNEVVKSHKCVFCDTFCDHT